MGISYLIDNSDYSQDPFLLRNYSEPDYDLYDGPNLLSRVQVDIASHLSNLYTAIDVKDYRFSYSLKKIQGCAAFSIKAIFLRPSDSFLSKWVGGLCIFALPVGHLMDFGVNTAVFCVHTALAIDTIAVGIFKKGLGLLLPKKFIGESDEKCFDFSHTRWLGATSHMVGSFFFGFAELVISPLYYLRIMNPLFGLKHSYWVYDLDSKKFHLVLDQEKVRWLQKKYGYTNNYETLLKLCVPKNPAFEYERIRVPSNLKLSYEASKFTKPEDIKITATWISWKYAYSSGNIDYYNRINNICRTHTINDI